MESETHRLESFCCLLRIPILVRVCEQSCFLVGCSQVLFGTVWLDSYNIIIVGLGATESGWERHFDSGLRVISMSGDRESLDDLRIDLRDRCWCFKTAKYVVVKVSSRFNKFKLSCTKQLFKYSRSSSRLRNHLPEPRSYHDARGGCAMLVRGETKRGTTVHETALTVAVCSNFAPM